MERDRFRRLVQRSLRTLPPEIRRRIQNVEVSIEREPSREDLETAFEDGHAAHDGHHGHGHELFGLYLGVPLTERHGGDPSLPDRIVIFQGPLERHFGPRSLQREIQRTVAHEVAHHFGIDDHRLEELGLG
ncbi:MAG: metallopeptidase family protein [Dehalococcoidia bacterium]